jgi:hypothetical protein
MIIGEKNTDLKRLTGRLKLRFLTEIETKAKKSPTLPGLVSPESSFTNSSHKDVILQCSS